MKLGGASGEIECLDAPSLQHPRNEGQVLLIHHLGAGGPGVHMAVDAGLIALVAEVHLKRGETPPP